MKRMATGKVFKEITKVKSVGFRTAWVNALGGREGGADITIETIKLQANK